MTTIVTIVEGDGEVRALPVLLRRLAEARKMYDLQVPTPIRVHKDQFIRRPEEFNRKVQLAIAKAQDGVVLVVLDADDDCPVDLASDIVTRANAIAPHGRVAVVIAQREYEGWFLAAAESIAGARGLDEGITAPGDPDSIRDAKGWLSQRMGNGRYHEVSDQPALSAVFDIEQASQRSRSLRKLVKAVDWALQKSPAA
ncbi:MAG: hypothetical protein AMXMBFR78_21610 [Rubrivivax sp.]|jgi:hypothetical protein